MTCWFTAFIEKITELDFTFKNSLHCWLLYLRLNFKALSIRWKMFRSVFQPFLNSIHGAVTVLVWDQFQTVPILVSFQFKTGYPCPSDQFRPSTVLVYQLNAWVAYACRIQWRKQLMWWNIKGSGALAEVGLRLGSLCPVQYVGGFNIGWEIWPWLRGVRAEKRGGEEFSGSTQDEMICEILSSDKCVSLDASGRRHSHWCCCFQSSEKRALGAERSNVSQMEVIQSSSVPSWTTQVFELDVLDASCLSFSLTDVWIDVNPLLKGG